MGHWLESARDLVEVHAAALRGRPAWLFSCGPLGPPDALKPEGDPVDVADLMEASQAVEHRVFAGRLDRNLVSLAERAVVVARACAPGRLPGLGGDRRLRRRDRRPPATLRR